MSGLDKPRRMRELFAQPGIIVCPGVYDGLTVKLVEQAGFDVAVVSGAAVSASLLGAPDLGVMSMTELLQQVRNIVGASDIPIIADAETDEMLGCHMIGANVSDLIQEIVLAFEYRGTAEDIGITVHSHPTLGEAVKEAALAVLGRPIHI